MQAEDSDVSKLIVRRGIEHLRSLIKEQWTLHEEFLQIVRRVLASHATAGVLPYPQFTLLENHQPRGYLTEHCTPEDCGWSEEKKINWYLSKDVLRATQYARFEKFANILSNIKDLLLQADDDLSDECMASLVASFLHLYPFFNLGKFMVILSACLTKDAGSDSGYAEAARDVHARLYHTISSVASCIVVLHDAALVKGTPTLLKRREFTVVSIPAPGPEPVGHCTLSEEEWYRYL